MKPTFASVIIWLQFSGVYILLTTKLCSNWLRESRDKHTWYINNTCLMSKLEQRIFDLVNSGVIISSGKTNGDEYPADSIYNLCCGLQRDLRSKDRTDVNIFLGARFNRFRQILDSRMKNLKATGNHTRKRAEVIGEPIENQLWELKVLGDHDGQDSFGHIVLLC